MPKIHELLERNPKAAPLPNNGQARIADASEGIRHEELRAELQMFVCDGRFADGLTRILEGFLRNLEASRRQEAAWVSGFFGSGKSHLLKMLAHLWADTKFPDGATARGLVEDRLSPDIRAALTELDTRARRLGKPLRAAAGTLLEGNDQVRKTVLAVLLQAEELPTGIPQARFVFWLREQGALDAVRRQVEADEGDWRSELNSLHVSPRIARALRSEIPDFAPDHQGVRAILAAQFPPLRTDLTTGEFTTLALQSLSDDNSPPLTLLVLDEVQQYIGDSGDRSAVFTEVAEAIQTQFEGRVALVASGQSALSDTPALQKLRDRFRTQVQLTDADVEVVTREVLLKKKATAVPEIEEMFTASEGEVSRHLRDTRIGARSADRKTRIEDYPLLGSRRRFWEACLREVDARQGGHSQLRSQLRILHDSLCDMADLDLGAVIPASDLYRAVSEDLVSTGVLLNELHTRITELEKEPDSGLRRDLAALVFLVGKLPREAAVDAGVRADAPNLADLLVSDLAADSGPFRQRVEDALADLANRQILMQVGREYRIQTTEGAEWDGDFRKHTAALQQDAAAIAAERDSLFAKAIQDEIASIRLRQGDAKERRSLSVERGAEAPETVGDAVPVWVRDEWQVSKAAFPQDAHSLGIKNPTLHIYLPKQSGDPLRAVIVARLAAQRVLDLRGNPQSAEGREARNSMESRRDAADETCQRILESMLHEARVLQSGGIPVAGPTELGKRIEQGALYSLARLFHRFPEGDGASWSAALRRARDGSAQPFAPVGWEADPAEHPVAKEVVKMIGAGARGSAIQQKLRAAPFGWPQDAMDAALIALFAGGRLSATRNGQPIGSGGLDQAGVKAADFRPEEVVLTTTERIALRGLFQKAGVQTAPGEEERGARDYLAALRELAERAGGEPPLPARPNSALLENIARGAGNDQLRKIHQSETELEQLRASWFVISRMAAPRLAAWQQAQALLQRAKGLPVENDVGPQLDAIRDQRSLLDETDRVSPLAQKLSAALRGELTALHEDLVAAIRQADERLATDPRWTNLDRAKQDDLRQRHGLVAPSKPEVGTDENLLRSLADRPLGAWRAEADAVPERTKRALAGAAAAAPDSKDRPTTVPLRRVTLRDEPAVRAWVRETETALLDGIRNGPVVIE